MRRMILSVVAFAAACSIGMASAFAGPGCCSAGKAASMAKKDGCCKEGFPTMVMMVGEKSYQCPMSADKAAKESHGKIVYLVGEKKYDCKDAATVALADASEEYVSRFMSVACVVDGKVKYCDDVATCSKSVGKTVSAGGASCGKSATVVATKSETGSTCTKGKDGEIKSAMAKSEGSTCTKGKDGEAKTVLAKTEGGSSCCKSGAKTAMAKGEGSGCCKDAKSVKYMVAGRTFDSYDAASKAREQAMTAVKTVSMKYIVDGKEVGCSSQVCPKAKADGKVTYVVNNEKMTSESDARIAAAKAKYEAARSAAEKLAKA